MLEYSLALRRDIARAIRRHRPDVVITGYYGESWAPGMLNQADHIAFGRAVVDGVRDAANRWVFRELLDEGVPPWPAKQVLIGSPTPTHGGGRERPSRQGRRVAGRARAVPAGAGRQPDVRSRGVPASPSRVRPESRLGTTFAVGFEVINF